MKSEWLIEYLSLGKWRLWKIEPSEKLANKAIADRNNPVSLCRARKRFVKPPRGEK